MFDSIISETCTGSILTKGSIQDIPHCCNPVDVHAEGDEDNGEVIYDDDQEDNEDKIYDDIQEDDDEEMTMMVKRMRVTATSSASASPTQPSTPPLSTGKTHWRTFLRRPQEFTINFSFSAEHQFM